MSDSKTKHDLSSPRRGSWLLRLARLVLGLLTIGVTTAWLGGLVARQHVYLDLLTHFQVQYLVIAMIAAIGLFACGRRRWAIVPAIVAIVAGAMIGPWILPRPLPSDIGERPRLRVMQFNIYEPNEQHEAVIAEVRRIDPDVAVFQEVNERWFDKLEALQAELPYVHFQPAALLRGNLVRSRFPISNVKHEPSIGDINSPSMSMTVHTDGRDVSLLVAHTTPPHDEYFSDLRNRELLRLAQRAVEMPEPVILIGDLNTTMWSPHYRRFEGVSGLVNSRRGFGTIATFPMNEYRILRVPLDHCLVSPDIAVVGCERGRAAGSDHAPLIVDLVLP